MTLGRRISIVMAILAVMAFAACDADKQAIPDPAKVPKPKVLWEG